MKARCCFCWNSQNAWMQRNRLQNVSLKRVGIVRGLFSLAIIVLHLDSVRIIISFIMNAIKALFIRLAFHLDSISWDHFCAKCFSSSACSTYTRDECTRVIRTCSHALMLGFVWMLGFDAWLRAWSFVLETERPFIVIGIRKPMRERDSELLHRYQYRWTTAQLPEPPTSIWATNASHQEALILSSHEPCTASLNCNFRNHTNVCNQVTKFKWSKEILCQFDRPSNVHSNVHLEQERWYPRKTSSSGATSERRVEYRLPPRGVWFTHTHTFTHHFICRDANRWLLKMAKSFNSVNPFCFNVICSSELLVWPNGFRLKWPCRNLRHNATALTCVWWLKGRINWFHYVTFSSPCNAFHS